MSESPDLEAEERRLREQGDRAALAALFSDQEARLRRWVEARLDTRLAARLSASDVVQEIYLDAEKRLDHFRDRPEMPFRIWIRLLADQRLVDVRRLHLGAQARDAGREVSLDRGRAGLSASAAGLAERLAGDFTSPSRAAIRRETLDLLVEAIESMDPMDREVLTLRHFDELTNDDVAHYLGIPKGTASKRYVRALGRLREILERIPGLMANDDDD
ncbi:MAG: sigma-70 family RNA polymerase sigma factor [Isosphaeraceae bacterium]|nr:sigma-70 family RNA polymerase sigma factor [Isosphaeraceae bacterium]